MKQGLFQHSSSMDCWRSSSLSFLPEPLSATQHPIAHGLTYHHVDSGSVDLFLMASACSSVKSYCEREVICVLHTEQMSLCLPYKWMRPCKNQRHVSISPIKALNDKWMHLLTITPLVPQNMAVVLFPYSLLNYIHEFVWTPLIYKCNFKDRVISFDKRWFLSGWHVFYCRGFSDPRGVHGEMFWESAENLRERERERERERRERERDSLQNKFSLSCQTYLKY